MLDCTNGCTWRSILQTKFHHICHYQSTLYVVTLTDRLTSAFVGWETYRSKIPPSIGHVQGRYNPARLLSKKKNPARLHEHEMVQVSLVCDVVCAPARLTVWRQIPHARRSSKSTVGHLSWTPAPTNFTGWIRWRHGCRTFAAAARLLSSRGFLNESFAVISQGITLDISSVHPPSPNKTIFYLIIHL
jgi:hypothetical protein